MAVRELCFADDAERKPVLYACSMCGAVHSPRTYAARDEIAHAAARQAAEDCFTCMTDRVCTDCGGMTGSKHYMVCKDCRWKRKLAACERIDASEVDYCFAVDGDTLFESPEEAAESGHEWVHPAKPFRTFAVNIDNLIENLLDDHFEDASEHDLKDWSTLHTALVAFNKAQTSGTYDMDTKRIANIAHLIPAEASDPTP